MKKIIKTVLLLIAVVILCDLIYYVTAIGIFAHITKWKCTIEDFEDYKEDFNIVAEFCSDYIKEKKKENSDNYDWLSISKGSELYFDGENLELPEEVQEAVISVADAISDGEVHFDIIRCYDDSVYFCTQNGSYSVVYSPNEKPRSMSSPDEKEKVSVRKIEDGWYHVVPRVFR